MKSDDDAPLGPRQRRRPETIAALVNGTIVLVSPFVFMLLGASLTPDSTNSSTTVRAPGGPDLGVLLQLFITISTTTAPFAMLAAWRTWVHAKRWRERQDRGWRGVAEAGACGLAVALLVLAPGIVTRPLEAPPFILAYGGAALILGLVVGLFLRTTAMMVLKVVGGALEPVRG